MVTNIAKPNAHILYPELSYTITGCCFKTQNMIGRFCREKQYCDALALTLAEASVPFIREYSVPKTGDRLDFLINDTIILEAKAVPFLSKPDYYQTRRYLDALQLELGLLVNFHDKYLKPHRILRRLATNS